MTTVVAAFFAVAAPARADMALLMFEEPGCVWCLRWTEDVGGEYPVTPEGRAAPLVRLELGDPVPERFTLASPPRYSPTFVLVEDGFEVGRIEGYPGEDFFWGLLGRLLERTAPQS
ncbi:hypothetical protein P6F26_13120 [Roseibacterium sp. SDUM158017]|uniref:hypothetical protein n=1 Tax=Roseicyclus salinarum TaxID=3036773 RepID=UPI002414EF57|nr:hypothetical protein [Roseibacterium sp. SDUM158017]MDG4649386.1 hypothetical protein [Roseibacterium sp. SDUM158017]